MINLEQQEPIQPTEEWIDCLEKEVRTVVRNSRTCRIDDGEKLTETLHIV